jgi:hypothetical protein
MNTEGAELAKSVFMGSRRNDGKKLIPMPSCRGEFEILERNLVEK